MAEEAAETTVSENEQSESAEQSDSVESEDIKRLNKALAAERKVSKELASKLESLEGQVPTLQKELLSERRKTFAAEKKVPVSALSGDTPEEWEAAAEALLAWRAEQEEKPAKTTRPATSLKSGATGSDSRLDPQERAAAALRGMRRQ